MGDAEAYAECLPPDDDYISGAGKVQHGWKEIIEGHHIAFSAWARSSRLEGRIERLRFLTAVVYLDARSSEHNKRTVYSLVAQRLSGRWAG